MKKANFQEALATILAADPRYKESAYVFVREALDFTMKDLAKPSEGPGRHVSGPELLDGVRKYALKEYGPMARTVLARSGIRQGVDVGRIVFNLVDHGVLGKSEKDRLEDFAEGYSFEEAFVKPFRPASVTATPGTPPAGEPRPRSSRQQA
jgi:uncharacterized repeat protein (TIGR04138 family)